MDERDAAPVEVGDHLVPEHCAHRSAAELLNVGAAEPARADANELADSIGLGDLGQRRLPGRVQDDRFHAVTLLPLGAWLCRGATPGKARLGGYNLRLAGL